MEKQALLSTIQDQLKAKFGEAFVSAQLDYDFPVFTVKKESIIDILRFLKEDPELNFHFLTTLCVIHYPKDKGREFCVMYQLHNMVKNYRIRLKIYTASSDTTVPTATVLYPSANWMERQEYDFFGINFKGHPNLKRILNMDEMNYFPMRKEYALEDGSRNDKDDTMFGR
ncbi:MAG TPA: NADH-quinone oxidoreductase subunit C [Bacteroidia bacterium]|jgi:NADH-quinone oxidoreductase subunit C|nr:NADH-quinone oxidoreductase subunit C [Bacteroidia bacterium]